MQRIFFTLKMLWQYRRQLYQYLSNLSLQTQTIEQISLTGLKDKGIEGLILDYDGILAGYAQDIPDVKQGNWLKEALATFGKGKVFILSNRVSRLREEYFAKNFPEILFMEASHKKPYPQGIFNIMNQTHLQSDQILLIDDRLLTGILAALIAGIHAIWVTKPLINFRYRPVTECGFILLRWLDKILVSVLRFF